MGATTPTPRIIVRTFVSAVAVLLALVLTAIAVPAAWVDRNVVDENGFARISGELGMEPGFQERLAGAVAGSFQASVDLPEPIKSLAGDALEEAAAGMQSWPDYPAAWEETARNSHRLNFGTAGQSEEAATATALQLDIAPLVRLIRDHVASGTGIRIDVPDQNVVTLGQASHRELVERAAAFAPLWWTAALGAAVAVLLALAVARRRSVVMVFLGIGGLGLALLWTSTADLAGSMLGTVASANSVAELFKQEFFNAARADFGQWIMAAAWVSAAVLAVGLVLLLLSGRRRSPFAPGQRTAR